MGVAKQVAIVLTAAVGGALQQMMNTEGGSFLLIIAVAFPFYFAASVLIRKWTTDPVADEPATGEQNG